MQSNNLQDAIACLDAVADLAREMPGFVTVEDLAKTIVPMRVLLDRADALSNGSAAARDHKNAGDRKRRATKKTPGKKSRVKNPAAKSSSSSGAPTPK